jgi:hypothetical protein
MTMDRSGNGSELVLLAAGFVDRMQELRDRWAVLYPERPAGAVELLGDDPDGPFEVSLGDGNTFAELMGCGVAILEQVDPETQAFNNIVITKAQLELLLSRMN